MITRFAMPVTELLTQLFRAAMELISVITLEYL